ncbi:MAG: YitT family protein [Bacteroidales bacterium]|nr:YitT family protein [Bacteroidales bacterium]
MNPILRKLIYFSHRRRRGFIRNFETMSNYLIAREFILLKHKTTHLIRDAIFIIIGIISAGFGLKGFLLPNAFIDGGVTGISLLVRELTGIPLAWLILGINIPFIFLGYTQISRNFAIKSFLAIIGLALCVALLEYPVITSDKLLIAVFGGFFLGAGIGLSVRGGGVIDGTEILAVYITRKSGLSIGDIILIFNVMIFSVAAYFLGIETALYSILTYLSASKTVDFIIEGVEEYIGVTIISCHFDEIRYMITHDLGKGVTVFNGKRGYTRQGQSPSQIDIIYTVTTRLEIGKLRKEVENIDPHAFLVMHSVKDAVGGMIKKRSYDTH